MAQGATAVLRGVATGRGAAAAARGACRRGVQILVRGRAAQAATRCGDPPS